MLLDTFCGQAAGLMQFIGQIVNILKVLVPVIILGFAFLTLGKALISADDKETKQAWSSLVKKAILGIVIFFVPNIVGALFSVVTAANETMADSQICMDCITSPNSTNCKKYVK